MDPVCVKGVLITSDDQVVLLMNERNEWELPGGRTENGETLAECLSREFFEELGIEVEVIAPLDSYLLEVRPGKRESVVSYGCRLVGAFVPRISLEHAQLGLFPVDALPAELPDGYRATILAWHARLAGSAH
ncbi:NUDIX domain-containing protein [Crenobacter sp. SG2305]|uniref:NUDIX domain-containing protein n=1 Tax=Crenobacter oryzisoli TaxID=3056844 RepID=UPI0025AAA102|nr:NUDIX domain-containing protein [Crenobacter sp. SG2305]MDN0084132.1 NUDIX domain-containing protein [Crenobacter sp. SG2305]